MGYSGWNHMGGGMGGVGWSMGGGLLMLVILAVIVWVVVVLAKSYTGGAPWTGSPREKSPLDVLRERYARGEIERDEFEQKKRDLQ